MGLLSLRTGAPAAVPERRSTRPCSLSALEAFQYAAAPETAAAFTTFFPSPPHTAENPPSFICSEEL